MGRLDGKVALITGAARGQGEAEARLFVEEGARVVLADVLDEPGKRVAESLGESTLYLHHDVSQEESWAQAVRATTEAFGKLDVLVNNAGILHVAPITEITLQDYLRVIHVNQVGCFLGMKAVIPTMVGVGGGSIINLSSTCGIEGAAGLIAYVASKHAIVGMTKTAAMELGRLGIRVNAILPGGINTPMGRGDAEGFEDVNAGAIFAGLPLGRIGEPPEVARMALFLASDESSYCTGSQFLIDGGMTAGTAFG
jgi:3alpha(or 20beta)-hydroxysteroid dehydrogenase